jgi:subtilisin family serine protease
VKTMREIGRILASLLVVLIAFGGLVSPAVVAAKRPGPPVWVVPGEIIVKYRPGVEAAAREKILSGVGLGRAKRLDMNAGDSRGRGKGLEVVRLPSGKDAAAVMKALRAQAGVAYVQPNYLYKPCFPAPNDPRFGEQWGLENATDPTIDIGALQAWDYTTGSPTIVVGVLDTGVDTGHPELAGNIWTNPADPVDGLDNDGNGLIDDTNGWDFFWNDSSVFDGGTTELHGTHVAGIIAAAMNNSTGIAGVAPNVKIMPLKFMGPEGGSTSAAIQAINYAIAHGVRILNASWGSGAYDQALRDAIQAFGEAGGIFIAAAGNGDASGYGYNTDVTPFYPASYDLPNIISVAAVDSKGSLVRSSNTGRVSVDLGAPGASILGTIPSQEAAAGPAALEVSGQSGSRAVVWGFGAEMFTDAIARTDAVGRAMTALTIPPTRNILVVDDDENASGLNDKQAFYTGPLTSLGYNLTVMSLAIDADGPSAATMATYDAVVWFTGGAFGAAKYCLTDVDQTNLTTYLNGGGRLFLSGQDALWGVEKTSFVRNVLHTWNLSEWLGPVFHSGLTGLAGAYAGVSYSQWQGNNNEDFLAPWSSAAKVVLTYPSGTYTNAYQTLEGTSASAPFVAGVVGLLLSQRPAATPADVVQAIATTTTPLSVLRGVTVTGGMVNAPAALAAITRGVTVSPEMLALTEGGQPGSYTLVLRGAPSGDVTLTATPGPEVVVDNGQGGSTLTFTTTNWNVPQTMLISAVDDAIVEGLHTGLVTHTVTGGGYDGLTVSTVTAGITDNDLPVVTISESGGSTSVTEGGATDTYTVVLGRRPCADVTIIATPDSQVAVDNGRGGRTLTFTPADWSVPQTFTVSAVDDTVVEGPHTGTIAHAASGGGFTGVSIAGVTAAITDNDKPGLVITETGGSTQVTEGGAVDTYTLCLNGPPTGAVTVTAEIIDGKTTVFPTTHTFSGADWNVPQTVTVTAVNDTIAEGLHEGLITYDANGGGYTAGTPVGSLTVTITDNDAPGVSIIESGGSTTVTEGGATDTYQMVLTMLPSATVTITATAAAGATVSNGSGGQTLTFTPGNWSLPQTFTVTATDDTIVEGLHSATITHAAVGGSYTGVLIAPVTAVITDNDLPEATITESGGRTDAAEGAVVGAPGYSDTYTVVLVRQPSGTVTLTAEADNQVVVMGAGGTNKLTFTTMNWNVPQTLTVTAVDDAIVEGTPHPGIITHSTSGGGYTGAIIASVTANLTDNDLPVVTITQSGGATQVTEGGGVDTYTVVLGGQPSGPVTITVTAEPTGDPTWPTKALVNSGSGAAASTSLVFTPLNWSLPQTITVSAVDDNLIEGPHSTTITHTAAGGGYTGAVIAGVTAAITDNDTAGVAITESSGTTAVTEGGVSDTYTVVLTQLPMGSVTVTASTAGGKLTLVTGGGVPGPTATLTFTTANWSAPQTVTVTAVDDPMVEGPHTATVAHTAAGGGYDGVAIANVSVSITDNDIPGVTITESGGSTAVTEGGAADTYQVVLTCQPNANVSLTAVTSGLVTVTGPSGGNTLTFTTANWNVPQVFTVTAVNDAIVEGTHLATITHSSTGGGYWGVSIAPVSATITDNDIPSLTVVESDGSTAVTEGATIGNPGASDTYTLVLNLQPCANVTLTVTAGPPVRVAVGSGSPGTTATLTFTTANWSTPQTVTVTAFDDELIEGLHSGPISHSASGGAYDPAVIAGVTAAVTDDDIPGLTVVESGGDTNLTEGVLPGQPGGRDTYTVALAHVPNGPVTFTVAADGEAQVAAGDFAGGGGVFGPSAGLTFTQADWSVAQTITIQAVDDAIVQGLHTATLSQTTAGGGYGDVVPLVWPAVTAHIADNDLPSVTVTPITIPAIVTEGVLPGALGGAALYTIVLDRQPCAPVTVTAAAGAELSVAAGDFTGGGGVFGPTAGLVFTPLNWNVVQAVTIMAFDDLLVEGLHLGAVTHTASGGAYDGAVIAPASATINDNDPPGVIVSETGGSTLVTEGGNTDTYTIVLTGQPATNVTVTAAVALSGRATLSTAGGPQADSVNLTFTNANWNVPQTITVAAVDDLAIEGPHSVAIAHTAVGSGYDGTAIAGVTAAITDNDYPGVTITESGGSTTVTEGVAQGSPGGADTYTVVLDRQPTGDVTFTAQADSRVVVAAGDFGAGGGVFGVTALLTFTQANWNTSQTITVRAVDDLVVEGAHDGFISHTTSGGAYGDVTPMTWAQVTAHVTDNDAPGVTVVHAGGGSLAVTEGAILPDPGAIDTYTVVLDREPMAPVTITGGATGSLRVAAGDWSAGGGVFGPSCALTFTPLDWNTPKTITVMAFDDLIAENVHPGSVGHTATGGAYDGVAIASMTASITDNDLPSVLFTETGGSTTVTEGAIGLTPGASDTYTAALSHQPSGTVTVTLTTLPSEQITLAKSGGLPSSSLTLTYTTLNWNVTQTITVRPVDDTIVEGPHPVTVSHATTGGGYDGSTPTLLTVNVVDNDVPGVTVSESGGATRVTEGAAPGTSGASDTYTVVLTRRPCATVTVSLAADSQVTVAAGGGVPGPSTVLTFTTANWNVAQTITVRAVDDLAAEGLHNGIITHSAAGGAYDGVTIRAVTAIITDNDFAGVAITQTGGATAVAEGAAPGTPGATDTYAVVLTTQPSGTVTVIATPSAEVTVTGTGTLSGGASATLTFTTANWSQAQNFTVAAVNDSVAEGLHTGVISHAVVGGGFTGVPVSAVTVSVTDNDPGVIVATGGELAVVEGGSADVYTLVLSTQPVGDVTITITPDLQLIVNCGGGGSPAPGAPGQVTFTSANWSMPRAISVSAPADSAPEGRHSGTITQTVAGGDPIYGSLTLSPLTVVITEPLPPDGLTFDPRQDSILRLGTFGVSVFLPAGLVVTGEGDRGRLAIDVGWSVDESTLAGGWLAAGPSFGLRFTIEGPGGSVEVHEFLRPITVAVKLDPATLTGLDPEKIGFYVYRDGAGGAASGWAFMPGGYDPATGILVAQLDHFSQFGVLVSIRSFGDVKTHWARKDIEILAGREVIRGVAPYLFAPEKLVTRAQFCALLVRALDLAKETSGQTSFGDVPEGAWYAVEVHTAYDAGLVQGLSPTSFGPERPITRQELAVLIFRSLHALELVPELTTSEIAAGLSGYSDASTVAAWAREGVAGAISQGIVRGRTAVTIVPSGTASRAEAAVMLKRFMGKSMNLPLVLSGPLQVSDVGRRHYEIVAAGGQVYDLVISPLRAAFLEEIQRKVGGNIVIVGTPAATPGTVYSHGIPLVALMTLD